jgi:protein-S-isoprenylcysteine O-methyltransferase
MTPRTAAFVVLFALTGAIGGLSKRLGAARGPARERRSGMVLGLAHTASLLAGVASAWTDVGALAVGEGFAWAAVGGMGAAFAVQVWAMRTLGPLFTMTLDARADQAVVQRGPYRLVRHPGYLAQILFWIAFALACRNAGVLAVVLVSDAVAYGYRIRVVESLLHAALGARYADYAARRARLVPGVW